MMISARSLARCFFTMRRVGYGKKKKKTCHKKHNLCLDLDTCKLRITFKPINNER